VQADLRLRWALFLDFDGTLADIATRPDQVCVPPELPALLTRLSERFDGALAIVTGRSLPAIGRLLEPFAGDIIGSHGLEQRLGGVTAACRAEDHPKLRAATQKLARRCTRLAGVSLEDKGCSVAVHWREAPEHENSVLAEIARLMARLGPDYRVQYGKAVAEVLPTFAAKGTAISQLMTTRGYSDRRPIFIGDDLSDESGFEAVNAVGGLSIKVGDGPTLAQRRVRSPILVRQLLATLVSDPPMQDVG
jgi:trehalose 6-phosphate phosphatase